MPTKCHTNSMGFAAAAAAREALFESGSNLSLQLSKCPTVQLSTCPTVPLYHCPTAADSGASQPDCLLA